MKRCDINSRRARCALLALAALAALAACTSNGASTGSTALKASRSAEPPQMGTEVIKGSTATIDRGSVTIMASGVFADKGILKLPIGDPRTFTFRFDRGNLVVLNATGPTADPVRLDKTTCAFSQSLSGTFRVLSGSSTGSYAGATGRGNYTFNVGGTAPKRPNGTCDTSSAASAAKAVAVLLRGPVLLNPLSG